MERKKIVGYEYARNLMRQLDWKLRVTITASATRGLNVDHIEIYHPKQDHSYTVRRDSGKRLMQECYVCGHVDDRTAIMCYDHDGSNPELI